MGTHTDVVVVARYIFDPRVERHALNGTCLLQWIDGVCCFVFSSFREYVLMLYFAIELERAFVIPRVPTADAQQSLVDTADEPMRRISNSDSGNGVARGGST